MEAPSPDVTRPRTILYAAGALILTGVAAVIAALSLLGEKSWLVNEFDKANKKDLAAGKLDKEVPLSQVKVDVDSFVKSQLTVSIMLAVLTTLMAVMVYRGRPWAKWTTVGMFVLASILGLPVGLTALLSVGSDIPAGYRFGASIGAAALLGALIMVTVRPSADYFAAHRPGYDHNAPRPLGLFAPRPRPSAGGTGKVSTSKTTTSTSKATSADSATKGPARTSKRPPVQTAKVVQSPAQPVKGDAAPNRPAAKSRAGKQRGGRG